MNPPTDPPLDGELNRLHHLVLEMANLTINQFDNVTLALNQQDTDLAVKAMQQDNGVDQYELKIDAAIIDILARHNPPANDLRAVLAISKFVTELERIGDELVKIGSLTIDLYSGERAKPNRKLLREINKTAEITKTLLAKTAHCFDTRTVQEAYQLIHSEDFCHKELKDSLGRQFNMLMTDVRLIGTTLAILQIINGMERCGKHCISIAEQMVFMLDDKDIRHQKIV